MDSNLSLDVTKDHQLADFPVRVVSVDSERSDGSLSGSNPLPSPVVYRAATLNWDGELPAHHKKTGKGYQNPWSSAKKPSILAELLKTPFTKVTPIPENIHPLESVTPSFARCLPPQVDGLAEAGISITWLGHASVLAQFRSLKTGRVLNVLFDPVLSERASPFAHIGPKRQIAAPVTVEDLPMIDYVCISHNHYDHLDKRILARLASRPGNLTQLLVPLGNTAPLLKAGIAAKAIHELDWWDAFTFPCGVSAQDGALRVTCTPAQHGSCRTLLDCNNRLWSSWVIEHIEADLATKTVFFGGDTGYRARDDAPVCPAFAEIGKAFRDIDVACIPIWRGACLSFVAKLGLRLKCDAFTRTIHATPKDAVSMHEDLGARQSIAIHYGTFVGSQDETLWSIQLLREACSKAGVRFGQGGEEVNRDEKPYKADSDSTSFSVLNVGQTVAI